MLRDQIRGTPEYQQIAGQEQAEAARTTSQQQQAVTLGEALSPVLNWEKGDVEFWLQVAQLIVLVLILREMQGS